MPLTFDDVQAKKTRRTVTHPVVTDDDAVVAYRLARKELEDARAKRLPAKELTDLQRAARMAEAVIRSSTLLFRLRALPPGEYKALRAEHPPGDADHAELAELTGDPTSKAQFRTATFGPALVAACLIEPRVTVEQATEWQRDWNEPEWAGLLNAAILANQTATSTAGLVFS